MLEARFRILSRRRQPARRIRGRHRRGGAERENLVMELARDLQFFSASAADAPAPTRLAKPEPSQPVGAGMVGGSVLTLPPQPNPSNTAPD